MLLLLAGMTLGAGDAMAQVDYGDAPDTYMTLSGSGGPSHTVGPLVFLGTIPDVEPDGQPNPGATGDGADEDGVTFPTLIIAYPGFANPASISITNGGAIPGLLDAWIDFNQNGIFDDPSERITPAPGTPFVPGTAALVFTVPTGATPGATFARFRISAAGALTPGGGPAATGEVEDYAITLTDGSTATLDFGDAPDSYKTLVGSDGARHTVGGPKMGSAVVDAELEAFIISSSSDDAIGDTPDDEDGVTFNALLARSALVSVDITVNGAAGRVEGWIDFNGDGDFDNPLERIIYFEPFTSGQTRTLTFGVPVSATLGDTWARFRVSTVGQLSPFGLAADGEVEDYEIEIVDVDFGDAPDLASGTATGDYKTYVVTPWADGGPSHIISGPRLGATVDGDPEGQPNATATGDTDDGVSSWVNLTAGLTTAAVDVNAQNAIGEVYAWIDFDQDGAFADPSERIINGLDIAAGNTASPTFTIPVDAELGTTFARFRVVADTEGNPTPLGSETTGEVEDYQITIDGYDWGDADGPTTASHKITGPILGTLVDVDIEANKNGDATYDDVTDTNDDDDGVTSFANLGVGVLASVSVEVTGAAGDVYAWVDFDDSGAFDNDEKIIDGEAFTAGQSKTLTFTVESLVTAQAVFARFRVVASGAGDPGASGSATSGEVEDYEITLLEMDFGDAPDPLSATAGQYPTLLANDGARHVIAGPKLGASVDRDDDGQPNATATGDSGDEDGVSAWTTIFAGAMAASVDINVQGGVTGEVYAWIDFNQDGVFTDDLTERIINGLDIPSGNTPTPTFAVPLDAELGTTFARFRVVADGDGNPTPTGLATAGEVEDYQVTVIGYDWGDALNASGTAFHEINGPTLGALVDAELSQANAGATEDDDVGNDDEDGVTAFSNLSPGLTGSVDVNVQNASGKVYAWIDFNDDGDFTVGPGEAIIAAEAFTAGQTKTLTFPVPSGTTGDHIARFRVVATADGAPLSTAGVGSGEVEDYIITVVGLDFGDALDDFYNTTSAEDGPSHVATGPILGSLRDVDNDGQDSANADGDDTDGGADEDGITFQTSIVTSATANTALLKVVVSGASGKVDGWMDFNADNDFADTGENIISTGTLAVGTHYVPYTVPSTATTIVGTTYARFRISTAGGLLSDDVISGVPAVDGEVEDYEVTIVNDTGPFASTVYLPTGLTSPITIMTTAGGRLEIRDSTLPTPVTVFSVPDSYVGTGPLTINGTVDNDAFVIDYTNGAPPAPINIYGGANTGPPGDDLTLNGPAGTTSTYVFTNAFDGTIQTDAYPLVSYYELEPIADNMLMDNRIFTFSTSAETIELKNAAAAGKSYINSTLGEAVTFTNPTTSITVNGGDVAGDDITLKTLDAAYSGTIAINGGAGDDDFVLDWTDGDPMVHGVITWTGGTGADTYLLDTGTGFGTITHDLSALSVDFGSGGNDFGYATSEINTDNLSATTRVFDLTAGADTATLEDDSDSGDSQSQLNLTSGTAVKTIFKGQTGVLTVNGLGGVDALTFKKMDSSYSESVVFNGGDANDTFSVDFGMGNPITTTGVTYHGDGHTSVPGDVLALSDGSPTLVDYVYTDANSGTITADGKVLTYDTIEPITDGLTPTTRTFTFSSATNTITLANTGAAGDFTNLLSSTATSEATTFTAPTGKLTVFGGSGVDTFTLTELDTAVSPSLGVHFRGLAGDDVMTAAPSKLYTVEMHGGDGTGDSFDLDISSLTPTPTLVTHVPTNPGIGSYTFDNSYKTVTYDTIETIKKGLVDPYTPVYTETGVSVEPTITWTFGTSTGFAAGYTLEIDTQPDFLSGSKATLAVTLPTLTYTVDYDTDSFKLQNYKVYYWRICDTVGANTFCGMSQFLSVQGLVPELTYPVDALTIYDTSFNFSWNVANPAPGTTYFFELDDSPWDGTPTYTTTTSSTTLASSSVTPALVGGKTYTWRVTVKASDGTTVALSDVETFTIAGGAVVPTPSYPTGGLTVYVNDLNFSWYPAADFSDLTFDIRYSYTSCPTSGAATVSGITGLKQAVTGLVPGKTYCWAVRSKHTPSGATSGWSTDQTFVTAGPGTVTVPTPTYPVSDLVIYTTAPKLSWFLGNGTGGVTYDVEFTDLTAVTIVTYTALTTTYYQTSGLVAGHSYSWKVKSKNGVGGDSGYSSAATFSVVADPADGTPVLSWPVSNPTLYTLTPTFNWYLSGSAANLVSYTMQWDDDAGFGSPVSKTGLTEAQYHVTAADGLVYGKQYYWRVKAVFTAGSSAYVSDSFNTVGTLSTLVPQLAYPVGGLEIPDDDVTFSWYVVGSLDAVSYFEVVYSITSNFNPSTTYTTTVTPVTGTTLAVTGLDPGALYYWKVRATNDSGTTFSSYSSVATFVVPAGASAVLPITGSPVGGVSLRTATPTLSWFLPTSTQSQVTYDLEYGKQPDLSDAVSETGLMQPFFSGATLTEGTYYWRARSVTVAGEASIFSEIAEFSTSASTATAIEDELIGEVPESYNLGQNYPNPFNPSTTIEYSVPTSADVTIRVYNMLGQVVRTLVSARVQAGVHRIVWDARDQAGSPVTSGLYIYRIQTADYSQARTLVLLK